MLLKKGSVSLIIRSGVKIRAYILAKIQSNNKLNILGPIFESIVKYTIKTSQCLPPSTIEFTIMQDYMKLHYNFEIDLKLVTKTKERDKHIYHYPDESSSDIHLPTIYIVKDLDTNIYSYLSHDNESFIGGIKMHKKTRRQATTRRHKKTARHKKTIKRRQRQRQRTKAKT